MLPERKRSGPGQTNMTMKTNKWIISLSTVIAAALVAGCDSKPQPGDKVSDATSGQTNAVTTLKDAANQAVTTVKDTATAVTEQAKTAATAAAAEVKQVATNAVEQAKAAAATATTEAQKAVESAKTSAANALAGLNKQTASTPAPSATATAQAYIDKAKALVSEKKYQDALASLKELSGFQLTAEQQKMVDDLKATIQTALGSDATKSLDSLFKK